MKLTTVTSLTLDGVTEGHRRIDAVEVEESRFGRFGWAPPLLDEAASDFISQTFQRADAFLFGRRTYEIFAGSWGAGMDPGNPVGEALNSKPKYVASTTLVEPQWVGTTVLSGDVAGAVDELRAGPEGELQVWGSGTLIRWLLDHRLIDELVLLTYPVIVGQGTRLFPTDGADIALELDDLRTTPKGMTIQTFRTAGRPHYET